MRQFHVNFKKKDNDTQHIYIYTKIFGEVESFKNMGYQWQVKHLSW